MTRISSLALWLTLNCLLSAGALRADEASLKDLEGSIKQALAATDLSRNAGLRITARIKFLNLKAGDLSGTYSKLWGSDNRQREEIKVDTFQEIEVALADKRWNFKNVKYPPLPIMLVEDMTGAFAYLAPPLATPSAYKLR